MTHKRSAVLSMVLVAALSGCGGGGSEAGDGHRSGVPASAPTRMVAAVVTPRPDAPVRVAEPAAPPRAAAPTAAGAQDSLPPEPAAATEQAFVNQLATAFALHPGAFMPSPTPTRAPATIAVRASSRTAGRSTGGGGGGRSGGGSTTSHGAGGSAAAVAPTSTRRAGATSGPVLPNATTPAPGGGPPPAPAGPTEDGTILGQLRRGGLVVYLRHGRTDWSQNDRELAMIDEWKDSRDAGLLGNCDRQRLLSDDGRGDARAVGDAFRRLGIPVGRVLTSQWCRVRETAELAFGRGDVAADRLFDTGYLEGGERDRYLDALRGLLRSSPGGSNLVLVGHMPQLRDVAGVSLEEGQAAIIRPGGGNFDVLRSGVGPGGWDALGSP